MLSAVSNVGTAGGLLVSSSPPQPKSPRAHTTTADSSFLFIRVSSFLRRNCRRRREAEASRRGLHERLPGTSVALALPARIRRDGGFPQLPLEDLPGGRHRQALHKASTFLGTLKRATRSFMCASSSSGVAAVPGLSTTTARPTSPHFASGTPTTAALLHGGVLVEHALDLERVDVLAAGDEHVLLAPTIVKKSSASRRARSPVWNQPCGVDGLLRGGLVVEVAEAHGGALRTSFAHLAHGQPRGRRHPRAARR